MIDAATIASFFPMLPDQFDVTILYRRVEAGVANYTTTSPARAWRHELSRSAFLALQGAFLGQQMIAWDILAGTTCGGTSTDGVGVAAPKVHDVILDHEGIRWRIESLDLGLLQSMTTCNCVKELE
jgi:hypothetical protein